MMSLKRYIGDTVEIIYIDQHDRITQRTIHISTINGNIMKAYCHQQRAARTFVAANILAIRPLRVAVR